MAADENLSKDSFSTYRSLPVQSQLTYHTLRNFMLRQES